MKKKKLFSYMAVFAIGALIAGIIPQFFPTRVEVSGIYPAITKEEMVQKADLIVKGRFVSCGKPYLFRVESQDGSAEYEYIRAEFQITEVLSGTPYSDSMIEIRLPGNTGQAAEKYSDAENRASLDAAEKILLTEDFFISTKSNEEYLLILNCQEKDSVHKEEGEYYVPFRKEGGIYSLKDGIWSNPQNEFTFRQETLKQTIQDLS